MHIEYLPELFIRLYQEGFIAAENTHHLQKVLMKYEEEADDGNDHEVQQCLEILDSYHKSRSVGLPLIPLAEITESSEPYIFLVRI